MVTRVPRPGAEDTWTRSIKLCITAKPRPARSSFPKTEQQLDTLESWSVGKITPEGLQVMQRFRRSRKQPELPWFCVLPEGCGDIAVSTVDAAGRKRVYRWKD